MDPGPDPAARRAPAASRRAGERATASASLAHLGLWLTGCAIYFSLARGFLPQGPQSSRQILLLTALSLYTGLCWMGTAVVLWRVFRGRRATIEPGAWLLFSLGCILTIDLGVGFLPARYPVRPEALQLGGTCLALALPALSRRMASHWKALFGLLAMLVVVQLVALLMVLSRGTSLPQQWTTYYGVVRSSVGLIALAAAVLVDHQTKRRHGWLHTVGVVAAILWLMTFPLIAIS